MLVSGRRITIICIIESWTYTIHPQPLNHKGASTGVYEALELRDKDTTRCPWKGEVVGSCLWWNLPAPKWHASFEVFGKGRVDGREECEWGNCSQVLWQERLGTGHLNVLTNWSYQRIHRLWSISGSVCILCRVSPLTCTQFFFWIWLEYFWSSLCWHAFFTFCQNASPLVIFYH